MDDNQQKRVHCGWWLKTKLGEKFGYSKSRGEMAQALHMSSSRLGQYFASKDDAQITDPRAAIICEVLGLPVGSFRQAWRAEPVRMPPMDPRGRRPERELSIALPREVATKFRQTAQVAGIAVADAAIEAVGEWIALHNRPERFEPRAKRAQDSHRRKHAAK